MPSLGRPAPTLPGSSQVERAADERLDRPAPDGNGRRPGRTPQTPRRRPAHPHLKLLVFIVGGASLGAEIAVARLLAPYFGASTIVWANTIAVVLGGLALGYWAGGRLADRVPTMRGLCWLVLAAALALAAIPLVAHPFLSLAAAAVDSISAGGFLGSLIGVLVLASAPVALLGAVAPYAVRLSVEDVRASGSVSGRLYALSTVGSIVGTFVAALVLIPFAGTQRTFLAFAAALALVSAPALPRRAWIVPIAVVVALIFAPESSKPAPALGRVVYETETPYQYARVIEQPDGTRTLELNEGLAVHSLYRPHSFLTGDYWDEFLVLPQVVLRRAPQRVAILGNAAGTTARAYGHFFPSTAVDAVELDGRLTYIGARFFGLRGPHLRLITADARPYLRSTSERHDAIFLDAYRQPYVPFYLATHEFFALARSRLTPGGVLIVNVGHLNGSSDLERVLTATLGSVFPYVRRDPVEPTNTLLVASSEPIDPGVLRSRPPVPAQLRELAVQAARRLGAPLRGGRVYTDDRAPIEWLVDRTILGYLRRTR